MAVDNSDTKALLHMNGSGTTFTDESGKTWTAAGNAQISSAQSVFGGASGLFDGTTDYISTAQHADFNLVGLTTWTFDWRGRFTALPANGSKFMLWSHGDSLTHCTVIEIFNNAGTYVVVVEVVNGSSEVAYGAVTITTNTWYAFSTVRNGDDYLFFLNGTRVATFNNSALDYENYTAGPRIGAHIDNGFSHNGYYDEFRFSRVARQTGASYTVPTSEYAPLAASLLANERAKLNQDMLVR